MKKNEDKPSLRELNELRLEVHRLREEVTELTSNSTFWFNAAMKNEEMAEGLEKQLLHLVAMSTYFQGKLE